MTIRFSQSARLIKALCDFLNFILLIERLDFCKKKSQKFNNLKSLTKSQKFEKLLSQSACRMKNY